MSTYYMEKIETDNANNMRRGLAVFFTGLPGSGKTTLATLLLEELSELRDREVVLFDGDDVRREYSQTVGFSKEDRNAHVMYVGGLSHEVVKREGVALCALIAPYREAREKNRERISEDGVYIEVHVSTPLEICIQRDPKGLYKKALAGHIENFTGIDDPYEIPEDPELIIDTNAEDAPACVSRILAYLKENGHIT